MPSAFVPLTNSGFLIGRKGMRDPHRTPEASLSGIFGMRAHGVPIRSGGSAGHRERVIMAIIDDPDLTSGSGEELQVPAAFTDVLGYYLRIAQEASFQAVRQAAGTELKPGWHTILTILAESSGLTPSELSRRCGRDRSTLTATLKTLSGRGLIERRRNPDDQRSYQVMLTPAGIAMQTRLRAVALRHDRRLDEIVGADKAVVMAALRRIVIGLGPASDTGASGDD